MRYVLLVFISAACIIISACAEIATGSAEISGLSLLHDRRTTEELLKDEQIEINATYKLNTFDAIRQQSHFNITAYNGKVLATGETPTIPVRNRITEILRSLSYVKEVHNHIAISTLSSFATRGNDTLLTAKVKTDLVNIRNIPGFDATRVKVISENGRVYLMGLVRQREANAATEVARRVQGVKQVIRVFEYFD